MVSFTTIFFLSIVSALTFTHGMAWIQAVWRLHILQDENTLIIISFFAWLLLCGAVHALFLWHTLRTVEGGGGGVNAHTTKVDTVDYDVHGAKANTVVVRTEEENRQDSSTGSVARKTLEEFNNTNMTYESYSSFVFDPRTHVRDGKCQFSDHPDLANAFSNEPEKPEQHLEVLGCHIKTLADLAEHHTDVNPVKARRSPCRELFVCFSPEYQHSSTLWKIIAWTKLFVLTLSYLLCLYFVIICIGATSQIASTRARLPAVHMALYSRIDEGPVCAFDNRGPASTIATFADANTARGAGFLVLHCGACGAGPDGGCSSWDNLKVEYVTRNNMAELAARCARASLFGGGGDDAITACLMEIGFKEECAVCWTEDIVCTKAHCAFIFLQSQMINNVGHFAVGEAEVTSASCEEAHCEVGKFVPCSGATRRRMNIVSSISRPDDQQCGIVDVQSWEDLFFGSGVA